VLCHNSILTSFLLVAGDQVIPTVLLVVGCWLLVADATL